MNEAWLELMIDEITENGIKLKVTALSTVGVQ